MPTPEGYIVSDGNARIGDRGGNKDYAAYTEAGAEERAKELGEGFEAESIGEVKHVTPEA